jgi:hypothetical protein
VKSLCSPLLTRLLAYPSLAHTLHQQLRACSCAKLTCCCNSVAHHMVLQMQLMLMTEVW